MDWKILGFSMDKVPTSTAGYQPFFQDLEKLNYSSKAGSIMLPQRNTCPKSCSFLWISIHMLDQNTPACFERSHSFFDIVLGLLSTSQPNPTHHRQGQHANMMKHLHGAKTNIMRPQGPISQHHDPKTHGPVPIFWGRKPITSRNFRSRLQPIYVHSTSFLSFRLLFSLGLGFLTILVALLQLLLPERNIQ